MVAAASRAGGGNLINVSYIKIPRHVVGAFRVEFDVVYGFWICFVAVALLTVELKSKE